MGPRSNLLSQKVLVTLRWCHTHFQELWVIKNVKGWKSLKTVLFIRVIGIAKNGELFYYTNNTIWCVRRWEVRGAGWRRGLFGGGGGGGEGRGEIRDGQDRDGEGSNHADLYTQIDILHTYSQIERQTDILHAYTQIDRQTFYIHTHR